MPKAALGLGLLLSRSTVRGTELAEGVVERGGDRTGCQTSQPATRPDNSGAATQRGQRRCAAFRDTDTSSANLCSSEVFLWAVLETVSPEVTVASDDAPGNPAHAARYMPCVSH